MHEQGVPETGQEEDVCVEVCVVDKYISEATRHLGLPVYEQREHTQQQHAETHVAGVERHCDRAVRR